MPTGVPPRQMPTMKSGTKPLRWIFAASRKESCKRLVAVMNILSM